MVYDYLVTFDLNVRRDLFHSRTREIIRLVTWTRWIVGHLFENHFSLVDL